MNGLTAMLGVDLLDLREGQTPAVTGAQARRVVRHPAREAARRLGVRGAKPEDEELVRCFGADVSSRAVDDYPESVRTIVPEGVDALRHRAAGAARPARTRDGGAIAVVRGWKGEDAERGIHVPPSASEPPVERTDWLEELRRLASDGTLQLRVAATYPPEAIADAQRLTKAGGIRGRAVIVF